MWNDERSLPPWSPRTTFVEDLSPQGPIVAFDVALDTVRRRAMELSEAIAVDRIAAGPAADALKRALAFAASGAVVMGLPADADATRQLAGVRGVAESALALAASSSTGPAEADPPRARAAGVTLQAISGPASASDPAHYAIALFRMRLLSLQRALERLHTALEDAGADVAAAVASVLAWNANALPHALHDTIAELQLIIAALEASRRVPREDSRRAQLAAAQQTFRDVVIGRPLDAARFKRAQSAVCDVLTRAALANVAMMMTLAIASGAARAGR